jgi:hypothetical protein
MLHLALSVVLIWLAINIAFVVLRVRATRSPNSGGNLSSSITPYRPAAISLHRRTGR